MLSLKQEQSLINCESAKSGLFDDSPQPSICHNTTHAVFIILIIKTTVVNIPSSLWNIYKLLLRWTLLWPMGKLMILPIELQAWNLLLNCFPVIVFVIKWADSLNNKDVLGPWYILSYDQCCVCLLFAWVATWVIFDNIVTMLSICYDTVALGWVKMEN